MNASRQTRAVARSAGLAMMLAAGGATAQSPAAYEPVVELDAAGRVHACGVVARTGNEAGDRLWLGLRFERAAAEPRTVLEARLMRADGARVSIAAAALRTSQADTAGLTAERSPAEEFRATGLLPPGQAELVFRDFVLAGGAVELELAAGTRETFRYTERAPLAVFRSYLACSAGLYGP